MDDRKSQRGSTIFLGGPFPEINDLKGRRAALGAVPLDKILAEKVLSASTRIGGPELLPDDGLGIKLSSGRVYYGGFHIENAYVTDGEKLRDIGVNMYSVLLPLLKICAEYKGIFYVLYKKENYALSITPLSLKKLANFPSILESISVVDKQDKINSYYG
ncbi:MAG: hypothetical protein M1348_01305 [Candidatus Parvarchaeota archaeon]|jgi:hypothetical protein|nr:hypothetical protein [Candidatus Parvarchaeota archaeon]